MNKKQNSLMRFSRTERLAQLSEQEIVIERKKREIQAKIEAQKKKESEEALKKLEHTKESKINKFGCSRKSSWSGDEDPKNKNEEKLDEQVQESLTNAFSNDGSFLDQFKKMSKSGLSSKIVDVQTLAQEKTKEFKKCRGDDKKLLKNCGTVIERQDVCRGAEKNVKGESTSLDSSNQSSFARQSLDSKTQLQLVPQEQGVSVVPSANNFGSLVPPCLDEQSNIQTTQNQIPTSSRHNFQLNSFPSNYSNSEKSVPHMQDIQQHQGSEYKNQNDFKTSKLSHSSFSKTFLNCIQPPLPITPKNIPPPSPIQVQNIPPPPKLPKDKELPKHRTESISLSLKTNTTKKLEAIPNPLEIDQPPSPKKSSFTVLEKKEILNTLQNISSAPIAKSASSDVKEYSRTFYNQDEDNDSLNEKGRHLAQLVTRCGGDFEESLRDRNQNDLNHRHQDFFEQESSDKIQKKSPEGAPKEKKVFNNTNKVKSPQRRSSESDSCYEMDALTAEKSDSVELKKEKNQNMIVDDKHHNEFPWNISKECYTPSQEQIFPNETSKESDIKSSGQAKTEERRKRKRKSRWGDIATTSNVPVNVQSPGKLPLPKSTLLSQLTRSDPGLIQYARQTFGSTNLSEEDWKKAEDHYKINLLYQDMVKKRAEVEKLERQGKFKYEYDSDEDTEGGTWEHKLRQQEMQATQLWAEELTRQAAGKHHIGDFLPPEELERFMEKYNAVKEGREPDLSDYKEYKLKEDNVGYRLLQKMGWNEGQGLGQDGSGIQNPVNKATTRHENQGLGVERPDGLEAGDDEYDAYRKRMMLAYRFRPNPLNNPRRPYY